MATEAHKAAILHMGFLLGSLGNKEVIGSVVKSIQSSELNRQYVEMLRDKLNAILVASDTGTPPPHGIDIDPATDKIRP